MKKIKNQIIIDCIMLPVSVFLAFDYWSLISAGDESLRRKIVFILWIVIAIGWGVKLIIDLKNVRRMNPEKSPQNNHQ